MLRWKIAIVVLACLLADSDTVPALPALCCASISLSTSGATAPTSCPPKPDDAYLEGPLAVLFKLGQNLFRPKTQKTPELRDNQPAGDLIFRGYGRVSTKSMNATEILNLRLWMAAEEGSAAKTQDLLGKGANPNWRETRSLYFWSPLHVATVDGHLDVVDTLVRAGAQVNMPDWDQWTPLHYAAYQGFPKHVKVARRLLDAGADVYEQTWDGRTPLAVARAYNNSEVAGVLEGFERDEARRRGFRPRRNTLDKDGMRKDREHFLRDLVQPYLPRQADGTTSDSK